MDKNNLQKGRQRRKSKTPDIGTWPPKMKRGVPLYDEAERPKTANLEKPSVLDPNLVNKLDMSLLSKELLTDSMTRFRLSKAISGGTSSFPSSSRCRQDVTMVERQLSPRASHSGATWCNGSTSKRQSFEQILNTRPGPVDVTAESPRMQKQSRVTGQDAPSTKKSSESRKLDDNNNRFVIVLEI